MDFRKFDFLDQEQRAETKIKKHWCSDERSAVVSQPEGADFYGTKVATLQYLVYYKPLL